jgi:hypothetical protein
VAISIFAPPACGLQFRGKTGEGPWNPGVEAWKYRSLYCRAAWLSTGRERIIEHDRIRGELAG